MNKISRLLIFISAILLLVTFFFPLWGIQIWAPQYPEGLSIFIWLNKITGDVKNINVLNHYIGMASIHPENFKELQYFPYCVGGLALSGLIVAALNKKTLFYSWVFIFLAASLAAFYDFYAWESTFGSQLNPDAAIKVEGMVYSPPLIGVKQLLNIEVWSLPDLSGYLIFISVLCALASLFFARRQKKTL